MIVEGWASRSNLDHYRHVVQPGAFEASIRQKGLNGPKGIKMLWQHQADKPLGNILELEQKAGGLWMKADINEKISWGKDVAEASKAIGGLNFSVGFFLRDADYLKDANGEGYLNIIRGELQEVSVVVFPGNDEATMQAAEPGTELEKCLASIAKLKLALSDPRTQALPTLADHIAAMKRILS